MSEPDVSDLLTVPQAIAIIDAAPVRPRTVELSLEEAQGLILTESIRADRDAPPFDKSLMDGFAVRSEDVRQTPVDLNLIGEVAAGGAADQIVNPRQALAIMTGAPLPPGADGVVPVEDTLTPAVALKESQTTVQILRGTTPGRYIARRGSDMTAGEVVLEAGLRLGPAQIAVAASVGAHRVKVVARPRVAVLATGDELVPIDQIPGPSQIRNSNSLMLGALLRALGCEVTDLGVAIDRRETIQDAIVTGLEHDVLFVSGGMSMGRYDHVPPVLRELGAHLLITKLRIKPGKPFVFATMATQARPSRFVFGLPGNPVSGFVCTLRLASRLIQRLGGAPVSESWRTGPLTAALEANGPREFYQPAVVSGGSITPLKWKGSGDIFTLARATGLLVRPENDPARPVGAMVRVLELPT